MYHTCRGTVMAQRRKHSSSTNVAWVQFPDSASYVGWVCWFSSLLCSKRFFPWYSAFSLSSKTYICSDFSLQCLRLVSFLLYVLLTLTTFLMLLILLVSKLCMRLSSFTWSACRMHMNSMCAGSPGMASAMELGFISVMRYFITLSSSSLANSIIPRTFWGLSWGGRGSKS